jgi:hypothetical protein
MNTHDDQSLALISTIIYLKDEMHRQGVPAELVEQAFDLQQQIYSYTHSMNERIKNAEADSASLRTLITEAGEKAGFEPEITGVPEAIMAYLISTIEYLRRSVSRMIKRTALFCAIAAVIGGLFAFCIPYVMIHVF